jgi:hypothetical protein
VPSLVESSVRICFCCLLSTAFAITFLATPVFLCKRKKLGWFLVGGGLV